MGNTIALASSKSGGSVAKRKDPKGSDHDVTVIVLNLCIQCIRSVLESLDRPVQTGIIMNYIYIELCERKGFNM